MSRENWVIIALSISSILLLTLFSRSDKPRETLFLLLLAQTLSWPVTIFGAYAGMITSPVRLFPDATDSNFMLAYIFLPTCFVTYYWHYPRNKNRIIQVAYTHVCVGLTTLVHVAIQKYTDLLDYITLSGYKIFPAAILAYYVMRVYADWYFYQLEKARSDNPRCY